MSRLYMENFVEVALFLLFKTLYYRLYMRDAQPFSNHHLYWNISHPVTRLLLCASFFLVHNWSHATSHAEADTSESLVDELVILLTSATSQLCRTFSLQYRYMPMRQHMDPQPVSSLDKSHLNIMPPPCFAPLFGDVSQSTD